MKDKKLAILGGMGPDASLNMYKTLIDFSIRYFGAKNNDDFPEIILHSIPIPDFISNEKDKYIALKTLKDRTRDLNKLNISYLSIACSTVHILLDDLQKESKASFVSMIEEVVVKVKIDKIKKVGLLGSPTTIKAEFYQQRLKEFDISCLIPSESQIRKLDEIIRNIIKGELNKSDKKSLIAISKNLRRRGAEAIILGCTELPLIFPLQYKIPVYNSVEILSMALLRRYYESNTISTL